jgi:hypothetical protein
MKKYRGILLLLFFNILFFLPIIITPEIFLQRGNDLNQFFWPLIQYSKKHLLNGIFPLWNNTLLAGTPLLPDPQSPLFYLPNIIFLIFPIGVGFIISSFFHIYLGSIGSYLFSKHSLGLNEKSSILTAVIYTFTSRVIAYLEAGHFGLIIAIAWIPFVILSTYEISKKPKPKWSLTLALSLSGLFYSHTTTFLFSAVSTLILLITLITLSKHSKPIVSALYYFFAQIAVFGLIAIALIPQLYWIPLTNRVVLTQKAETYPVWNSKIEVVSTVVAPWIDGKEGVHKLDTEKWIVIGISILTLSLIGFLKMNKKYKLLIFITLVIIITISSNNASPLINILMNQKWFLLTRVSTRIWFIAAVIITFSAGYGYNYLSTNNKLRKYANLIFAIVTAEILFVSWLYLSKPISSNKLKLPYETINTITKDKDRFRIFCVNRCITQIDAVNNDLELIDGYSTLIQNNYNTQAWGLTGGYWDYYTLSIPPFGLSKYQEVKPNAKLLGEYNTKYIISPYALYDNDLELVQTIDDYKIYKNNLLQGRSYFLDNNLQITENAEIITHSPNRIQVDTSKNSTNKLVLAEVYSPGWSAYLNGKLKVEINETASATRFVNINNETKFVEFTYQPPGYLEGKIITIFTLSSILLFFVIYGKKSVR